VTRIKPSLCEDLARYAGDSSGFLICGSLTGSECRFSEPMAGIEDAFDSSLDNNVTGGGLQRSYIGSKEPLSSRRVFSGAMTAAVTISE
jgi:hypothetical protein